MIFLATSAVREQPRVGFPCASLTLRLRERRLFAVAEAYDSSGSSLEAVQKLLAEFQATRDERLDLERCFGRVHLKAQAHFAAHPQEWSGATSLVAAEFDAKGRATLAHVGDVTAFRIHDGGVERVAAPHMLREERRARKLPDVDEDLVLRSLGSPNWKPDVVNFSVAPGDRVALLSGTVASATPHSALAEILRGPLESAASKLVDALPLDRVGACLVIDVVGS